MFAIEATGLTKTFRGTLAVDGVDLVVEEGDLVGLLGPNGAGQTTTLMMLPGITDPDAGQVKLLGHPLPDERSKALERTNFTASYISLPEGMRVKHYLQVFADLYGAPRNRVSEMATLLGITDL